MTWAGSPSRPRRCQGMSTHGGPLASYKWTPGGRRRGLKLISRAVSREDDDECAPHQPKVNRCCRLPLPVRPADWFGLSRLGASPAPQARCGVLVSGRRAVLAAVGVPGVWQTVALASSSSALNWTRQFPTTSPPIRTQAAMTYDAATRKGQDLVLEVLTINHRARALYQRLGMTEVARHGDGNIKITMRSSCAG